MFGEIFLVTARVAVISLIAVIYIRSRYVALGFF